MIVFALVVSLLGFYRGFEEAVGMLVKLKTSRTMLVLELAGILLDEGVVIGISLAI
jgi:hypothetical protein